jgi:hypothetical protein
MKRPPLLIVLFIVAACAQRPERLSPGVVTLALTNVNVVDVARGRVIPEQTIIIAGSRIRAIGSSAKITPPPGARIIDGTNRYVIPGLWDMHVHIPGPRAFEGLTGAEFLSVYVAQAVTGVRDMGADCAAASCSRWMRNPGDIERLRFEINTGRLLGPRIVSPGPIVDGPVPVHQGSLIVPDADSARAVVRAQVTRRATFIKVYDRVPRDAFFALAREARKLKIPFAGHVPASVSAAEASSAGQLSLEHLWMVLDGCSSVESELLARRRARVAAAIRRDTTFPFASDYQDLTDRTLATFDRDACGALAKRFRQNGTWLVPTNAGTWGDAMAGDSIFTKRAEFAVVPVWLQEVLAPFAESDARRPPEVTEQRRRWHRRKLEVLAVMHREGVPLLAGTDNPGAYTYPGFSLHDELALLVEAGLSPLEALRAATVNPALYLNAADSLGQVSVGYVADLALLDSNPLIDIKNTRRITAVVLNGRYLDSAALVRISGGGPQGF